jgi:hypothetical protein
VPPSRSVRARCRTRALRRAASQSGGSACVLERLTTGYRYRACRAVERLTARGAKSIITAFPAPARQPRSWRIRRGGADANLARKLRRNALKRLNPDSKIVWSRMPRTYNIWYTGARLIGAARGFTMRNFPPRNHMKSLKTAKESQKPRRLRTSHRPAASLPHLTFIGARISVACHPREREDPEGHATLPVSRGFHLHSGFLVRQLRVWAHWIPAFAGMTLRHPSSTGISVVHLSTSRTTSLV